MSSARETALKALWGTDELLDPAGAEYDPGRQTGVPRLLNRRAGDSLAWLSPAQTRLVSASAGERRPWGGYFPPPQAFSAHGSNAE